ncbi:MAG: hypothetical protein KAR42_16735 [candidate division Zixibacteria bacterium]|nr:hypothetical protein [candidate division Zixibacteria bacterium]
MITEILTEDQVVKSETFPIEAKVYDGGTQQVPSAATITVKNPNGAAQVEDQTVAVAVGGTMTYTLPAANTGTLWENAIIEITYTISSVDYKMVRFFDVVLNKISPCIVDEDLKDYYPELTDEIWSAESNYDQQIQEAFNILKRELKNKGNRPHMLIDGSQLRIPLIHKTFEIIFRGFFKEAGDKWHELYKEHEQKFTDEFDALVIKYDSDEDGIIDRDERTVLASQINLDR